MSTLLDDRDHRTNSHRICSSAQNVGPNGSGSELDRRSAEDAQRLQWNTMRLAAARTSYLIGFARGYGVTSG